MHAAALYTEVHGRPTLHDEVMAAMGIKIHRGDEADRIIGARNRSLSHDAFDYDRALHGLQFEAFHGEVHAGVQGSWINRDRRIVFKYAEGDRAAIVCADDEAMRAWVDYEDAWSRWASE